MGWDEPYVERDRPDTCIELELYEKLAHLKDFMEGVVEHLYGSAPLDEYKLDHCVEEMCHALEVKLPPGSLTIERKGAPSPFLTFMAELTKKAAVL